MKNEEANAKANDELVLINHNAETRRRTVSKRAHRTIEPKSQRRRWESRPCTTGKGKKEKRGKRQ